MKPDIGLQLELEKKMVAYGITRYKNIVTKAVDKGRGADTLYAQKLLHEFVTPVSEAIKLYCEDVRPGFKAKSKKHLAVLSADTVAYLGLRAVFDYFTQEKSLASLSSHIGMLIEDEAKFSRFHVEHKDYYEAIIQDFKRKGTVNYRHMHRVLTMKAKQLEISWIDWTPEERASVGMAVINLIMSSTDLIEKKTLAVKRKGWSRQVSIAPTQSCLDWMRRFERYAELLTPDRAPCVIPPDPWISTDQGGYYSPQLRRRTTLVKTRSKAHTKYLEEHNMPVVLEAINALQAVPWSVNPEVYEVLKEVWDKSLAIGLPQAEPYLIPESPVPKDMGKESMTQQQLDALEEWKAEARFVHTMNKERVSKCFQVIRVLQTAREYMEYGKFWFVYQCDFRGRIYTTSSGFSPQGADFAKGILRFAEGKPLTESGAYWLKVHIANTFGQDKLAYSDRVQWVDSNEELILNCATDPISHRDIWGNADKPWQFLAACYEFKRLKEEGIGMLSYLPVALDGSCNGLQNFSAMLRDDVGGRATNLVSSDVPHDIYSEVSKVCTKLLKHTQGSISDLWKRYAASSGGVLPRSLSKRPVMTLPYGSTQQSCREYIYKWMVEEAPTDFPQDIRFKASVFLTPVLWEAIGQVVVAATEAMNWIQTCASHAAKNGEHLMWETPAGFPVIQDRKQVLSKKIETELAGRMQLRLSIQGDNLDVSKQRLGSSPNFIHSMDASHLMMTLVKATKQGCTAFACIHDDYGTYASDTEELHIAIREAFLEMYSNHHPLLDFKVAMEERTGLMLPPVPRKGTLNLAEVLESPYFFG